MPSLLGIRVLQVSKVGSNVLISSVLCILSLLLHHLLPLELNPGVRNQLLSTGVKTNLLLLLLLLI